jgi:hypothetical protein
MSVSFLDQTREEWPWYKFNTLIAAFRGLSAYRMSKDTEHSQWIWACHSKSTFFHTAEGTQPRFPRVGGWLAHLQDCPLLKSNLHIYKLFSPFLADTFSSPSGLYKACPELFARVLSLQGPSHASKYKGLSSACTRDLEFVERKTYLCRARWLTPAILATWEAKSRETWFSDSLDKR